MFLNKIYKACSVLVGIILVSAPSLAISRIGNNKIVSPKDFLEAEIPNSFPIIKEFEAGYVSAIATESFWIPSSQIPVPIEIQIYSFKDKYPQMSELGTKQIKESFLSFRENANYQVLVETQNHVTLIGNSRGLSIGIFVTSNARGLVMVGYSNQVINKALKEILTTVVDRKERF